MDLLVATYALAHAVPILTLDADFAAIRRAGVRLTPARLSQAAAAATRRDRGEREVEAAVEVG